MSSPSAISNAGSPSAEEADRVERELLWPELLNIRRHLHRYPELSGQEYETTAFLETYLSARQIPFTPGPGGLGLWADVLDTPVPRLIAIRADIDALPISEDSEADYRSVRPGVMHACGHDAHSAIVLRVLCALRAGDSRVPCRAIFQSSEEAGQGALDMVQAGCLENVASIIAFHVAPDLPAGSIGITAGPQTACCQDFTITVKGRGGHAARPHLTVDPIAIGAQLVTTIYQLIPRAADTARPVVVTIGQFAGGHCSNVIPDEVSIRGTIRTLHRDIADETRDHLQRICAGAALAGGAVIEVAFDRLLPGVFNDPTIAALCTGAAREVVGDERLVLDASPSMGAEDFADYLSVVPGCMMRLGVGKKGREIRRLHTSNFDIAEEALLVGARVLVRACLALGEYNHDH